MNDKKVTVCELDQCAGCMACVSKCAKDAIKIVDSWRAYNAVIDPERCVSCGQCTAVCPNNKLVVKKKPEAFWQGWAKDDEIRQNASSGGIATAIAAAFVNAGGVCCSCIFKQGEFIFSAAENIEDVKHFSGSKYVKSNPGHIYREIQKYLRAGRKVLFIGLPCQVAAVKNYVGNHELLYTIDLICHGTPSPELLKMYLQEKKRPLLQHETISFRRKNKFFLALDQRLVQPFGVFDRYTYSFLRGIDYTENCYSCKYAELNRVSDITLGDAWGSELERTEMSKGLSLILCQSDHGRELIDMADLALAEVDVAAAVQNNKQLSHASIRPADRGMFFDSMKKMSSFSKAVMKVYPKECIRFEVKALLIRLGLLK